MKCLCMLQLLKADQDVRGKSTYLPVGRQRSLRRPLALLGDMGVGIKKSVASRTTTGPYKVLSDLPFFLRSLPILSH